MIFGKKIKQLRTQFGLSQQQMCDKLNMDQSTYSRYENGKTKPVSDIIIRVAKEFNVSTDWLLQINKQSDNTPPPVKVIKNLHSNCIRSAPYYF